MKIVDGATIRVLLSIRTSKPTEKMKIRMKPTAE